MTGNKECTKKFVLIFLLLSFSGFLLLSGSGQGNRSLNDTSSVQKKILILKKISRAYKHDWNQLGKSKKEVETLRHKATRTILSNVGVVMFKGLANVIQKFFDTPSPDGLLQDILQEMLFDTESEPKEKEMIQFWTKRNFLRRKNLRKTYRLLERVLRAPLERFDDDRGSFPYTEELWKEPDGKPDSYLKQITRRLNVIVYISMELSTQTGQAMEGLVKDRREVEEKIDQLHKELEAPDISETGELVVNGTFNQTLESWKIGGGGNLFSGSMRIRR